MRERLIRRIDRDLGKPGINIYQLSKKMKIPCNTLWRIYKGKSGGSIKSWETIEEYYRRKKNGRQKNYRD